MSAVLFRWTIADGMPSAAVFSRSGTAAFVSYTAPELNPPMLRAVSASGVSIVVRDARGGDTL